jgi:hypothetical protein
MQSINSPSRLPANDLVLTVRTRGRVKVPPSRGLVGLVGLVGNYAD